MVKTYTKPHHQNPKKTHTNNKKLSDSNETLHNIGLDVLRIRATLRVDVFFAVAQQTQQLLLLIRHPPIGVRVDYLINQSKHVR